MKLCQLLAPQLFFSPIVKIFEDRVFSGEKLSDVKFHRNRKKNDGVAATQSCAVFGPLDLPTNRANTIQFFYDWLKVSGIVLCEISAMYVANWLLRRGGA